jgi:hypothetical protein
MAAAEAEEAERPEEEQHIHTPAASAEHRVTQLELKVGREEMLPAGHHMRWEAAAEPVVKDIQDSDMVEAVWAVWELPAVLPEASNGMPVVVAVVLTDHNLLEVLEESVVAVPVPVPQHLKMVLLNNGIEDMVLQVPEQKIQAVEVEAAATQEATPTVEAAMAVPE